ncbi:MAG: class I SAM-dependent methyltransferase [Myxococcota bacterium]
MVDRRALLQGFASLLALWAAPARAEAASSFHRVYDDVALRDRFFLFLQNVFHLYPEAEFHQAIIEITAQHADDHAIYEALQARLQRIAPLGSALTYALPALNKQKAEMARQAAALLTGPGKPTRYDGYVEIGSTGRYVDPLRKAAPITGKVTLVNDIAPGYGPVDLLERGRVRKVGRFVPLGDYDPVPAEVLPDGSVDLVSSFIGFHHCPADRLEGFVASVHRVLRPGGRLLLREHDVGDGTMDTFVALAHDVFNAGVEVSWTDNAQQVRGFRSVADWTATLEGWGFRREDGAELQDHDPTDNTLVSFVRA